MKPVLEDMFMGPTASPSLSDVVVGKRAKKMYLHRHSGNTLIDPL
jgi:hypothetical protein